jgi:drug/metabolite transporter (DMT)-like permease
MLVLCAFLCGGTFGFQQAGSPTAGRFVSEMLTSKRIITAIMGVVGVLLIVRGAWGGVWPLSVQLVAGVGLVVYAVLRWRYTL